MSDDSDPYVPIECGLHSEYELAIMHRNTMLLTWLDQNGIQLRKKVMPLDLVTRDGQEYLVAISDDGKQFEIRLDKIFDSVN